MERVNTPLWLLFCTLTPNMAVDRALGKLRAAGQRMALVGTPEAPIGLVTLKDLVRTISGELSDW